MVLPYQIKECPWLHMKHGIPDMGFQWKKERNFIIPFSMPYYNDYLY
jgi:hypothetical protein